MVCLIVGGGYRDEWVGSEEPRLPNSVTRKWIPVCLCARKLYVWLEQDTRSVV